MCALKSHRRRKAVVAIEQPQQYVIHNISRSKEDKGDPAKRYFILFCPPTFPIHRTPLELHEAKKLQVLRQKRSMLLAETLTAEPLEELEERTQIQCEPQNQLLNGDGTNICIYRDFNQLDMWVYNMFYSQPINMGIQRWRRARRWLEPVAVQIKIALSVVPHNAVAEVSKIGNL